jgi:hypothetical protein
MMMARQTKFLLVKQFVTSLVIRYYRGCQCMAVYEQYGIRVEWVERIKRRMKDPVKQDQVKTILRQLTKTDLQNRGTVRRYLGYVANVLGEKLTEQQADQIVKFVIAQKIDPNNTLHLIKLWQLFR